MNTNLRVKYSSMTSVVDGGEWSASRPRPLCPRGNNPRYKLEVRGMESR
jgi:hypothetical protein